jgi:hypothetical protein
VLRFVTRLPTALSLRWHTDRLSNIDKQCISAVRTEAMGYVFRDEWIAPAGMTTPPTAEADTMHALRVLRADQLEGCTEKFRGGFCARSDRISDEVSWRIQ